MTFNVRVRRAAEADIREAEDWYEEQRIGLVAEFRAEVVTFLRRLGETPLIYTEAYRSVRRGVIHRFPYLVWYRVIGKSVLVLACTHARQNPEAIVRRLQ